ncbi:amidohydrolase family protein [Acidithrix sp. C25]|uniref:amidohydrolase family protein n=1 Tax=Acidithrix sp. C25 TaxID=1671482 RepID=UPI00191B99FF|nr:amidohydrolase family protein [Acidithrix sp. C25]CAG4930370.1 unnamed protein product [Acidithrix sp. C25]
MAQITLQDHEINDFVKSLSLPGIIDIHIHFMPDNVMAKVWQYFEDAGPLIGRHWPIQYKISQSERLSFLDKIGVIAHSALNYPHKADMAQWLNQWSADFAKSQKSVIHSATFYPEESAPQYVTSAIQEGARVFKSHVQVGNYDPRDPNLNEVWSILEKSQIPIVIHAGSGPTSGRFTGVDPISSVLERFPELYLIIAHMGMPDYLQFIELAQRYPNIYLDTTMAFTPFTQEQSPFPISLLPILQKLQDKILLGSDFPNIPYQYALQLSSLANLGLGDEWLRAILYENAKRLFHVGA